MYEASKHKPLSNAAFASRLGGHLAAVMGLLAISIGMGMVGYMQLEHLSGMDAFLNSAMLLGGMGPVNNPVTTAGKLFAGLYALYAGLIFILSAALIFTPIAHRILHKFHWDSQV